MEPNPRRSRKPSAGRPDSPPDKPVYFIDRDTGGRVLAAALRSEGYRAERHDDHFDQDTPDPFWIRKVAQRGWVILTCDRNIARKERQSGRVESGVSMGKDQPRSFQVRLLVWLTILFSLIASLVRMATRACLDRRAKRGCKLHT